MAVIGLVEEATTQSIIGAFFEVYNALGFGFLEHLYATALERELRQRGHKVVREARVVVRYKGETLGIQKLDMIVDDKVVVELKATLDLAPVSKRQLFNYLKATNLEVGLLLHFGPTAKFYRQIAQNNYTAVSVKSGSSV